MEAVLQDDREVGRQIKIGPKVGGEHETSFDSADGGFDRFGDGGVFGKGNRDNEDSRGYSPG